MTRGHGGIGGGRGQPGASPSQVDRAPSLCGEDSELRAGLVLAAMRHQEHLNVDANGWSLWGNGHSAWAAQWLPRWSLPHLNPELLAGLRGCAEDLIWRLRHDTLAEITSTADELLRMAVAATARRNLARIQPETGTRAAAALRQVRVERPLADQLWKPEAAGLQHDAAVLHARGHQRLLLKHWLEPAAASTRMAAADKVAFHRRGPAPSRLPLRFPASPVSDEEPGLGSWTPADARVRSARTAAARRGRDWAVVGYSARERDRFIELLRRARGRAASLTWQPLAGGAIRQSSIILVGSEVDVLGDLYLVIVWQRALLAVPNPAVVAVVPR